ncbi:MAG: GNAT family N-acetyltransferase [bacterium]|nr:GNAT family N-acetyltransferase [bacterium]
MTTSTHEDWATPAFDLDPVAPSVGPFPHRVMLRTWWEICGSGELVLLEAPDALIAMCNDSGTIRMLGESDLFDYHAPLGDDSPNAVAQWAADLPAGTQLELDSLPGLAADVFMNGLAAAGLAPVAEVHESAAVLDLPDDYEAYVAGLSKKQRHETRRKARRFTEILGPPRLERVGGADAVVQFAAMHRLADGRKGKFMDSAMEELFAALEADAGAVIDFLYGDGEEPVAAAFGFEDATAYYLYNSAYDTGASAASPGIVLVAELIRQALETGHRRFDFLKGDEVYKYRLGASARPLWRVRAQVGGAA